MVTADSGCRWTESPDNYPLQNVGKKEWKARLSLLRELAVGQSEAEWVRNNVRLFEAIFRYTRREF